MDINKMNKVELDKEFKRLRNLISKRARSYRLIKLKGGNILVLNKKAVKSGLKPRVSLNKSEWYVNVVKRGYVKPLFNYETKYAGTLKAKPLAKMTRAEEETEIKTMQDILNRGGRAERRKREFAKLRAEREKERQFQKEQKKKLREEIRAKKELERKELRQKQKEINKRQREDEKIERQLEKHLAKEREKEELRIAELSVDDKEQKLYLDHERELYINKQYDKYRELQDYIDYMYTEKGTGVFISDDERVKDYAWKLYKKYTNPEYRESHMLSSHYTRGQIIGAIKRKINRVYKEQLDRITGKILSKDEQDEATSLGYPADWEQDYR